MASFLPEGWHAVTPRIFVRNAEDLVAFLKDVLDATGDMQSDAPAVVRIGDSVVLVSTDGERDAAAAFLYVYVEDADDTYRRAVSAGAVVVEGRWTRLTATAEQRSKMRGETLGRLPQPKRVIARHIPDASVAEDDRHDILVLGLAETRRLHDARPTAFPARRHGAAL